MANNKFEEMLEHLVNEDREKAEELFHDIVVEKSRKIYEDLLAEETKDEEVDEDENDNEEKEFHGGKVNFKNDNTALVNLEKFEDGISPGQACVFYNQDKFGLKVLGGGWIKN